MLLADATRRRVAPLVFVRACTAVLLLLGSFTGCGTTRSTDTGRSATEQLLVSDAIDRAVDSISFHVLAGQTVFVDSAALASTIDKDYLVGSVRQQLLASGCILKNTREEADFIVEIRAGAVGTDRNDLLFGIPAFQVPQILPVAGTVPAAIPEIPFAKKSQQRGVAKIAVFAYSRDTGQPIWQSGLAMQQSTSSDIWVFGTGPYQKGTIHDGTKLAGGGFGNPLAPSDDDSIRDPVKIASEAVFEWPKEPTMIASEPPPTPAPKATPTNPLPPTPTPDAGVQPVTHEAAVAEPVPTLVMPEIP